MTNPQAWKGDYTQLKFYPSRGVCAVTVEIPLEEGTAFVAAFGTPLPKSGIPIALARLNKGTEAVSEVATVEGKAAQQAREQELKGGPLAKRAGILCGENVFSRFLIETKRAYFNGVSYPKDSDVADFVREYCGVESRAELDHDPEAAKLFHDLEASYRVWLKV
jgi:hypothetical protein